MTHIKVMDSELVVTPVFAIIEFPSFKICYKKVYQQ